MNRAGAVTTARRRPLRVVQYGVHDPSYPRNSRLRAFLEGQLGARVRVVRRSRAGARPLRALRDLRSLCRAAAGADLVVLSEFRSSQALVVRAVASLSRARLLVDCFVLSHETAVGDWGRPSPRSPGALRLAVLDALAVHCAHLVLTDTEPRAAELVRRHRPAAVVLPLAVGAPGWARWQPPPEPHDDLRVLYYGGYVPLHGVDLVVDALAAIDGRRDVSMVFVGDGPDRGRIEARVAGLGPGVRCEFVGAVPESELRGYVARADVVLGVFGTSVKARGVVANKVWQGLACGRSVITQRSSALAPLAAVVGGSLVQTEPGCASSLAQALVDVRPSTPSTDVDVHRRLDELVAASWQPLAGHLMALVRGDRRARHGRGARSGTGRDREGR